MKKLRLAVIATHPIQYQAPIYKMLENSKVLSVEVLFASDFGQEMSFDSQFGIEMKWDVPLTEGYNFRFLNNYHPKFSGRNPITVPAKLYSVLTKKKFDAVLIYGYAASIERTAITLALARNIPILLKPDGINALSARPLWKQFIRAVFLKFLYCSIDKYLTVGSNSTEHFLSFSGNVRKLVASPYCVDNDFFKNEANKYSDKSKIRKELGIEKSENVLLFCGKLIPQKNPFVLIDILSAFEKTLNLTILIVGEGELRKELEEKFQSRSLKKYIFAGFQNQSKISRFYAAADAIILPSLSETWGLVINEAMNFGLPAIVSSRVGCAPDLIIEGVTGFVFEFGNADDLLNKVYSIFSDRERLENMKNHAKSHIDKYSLQNAVDGIEKAIIDTY